MDKSNRLRHHVDENNKHDAKKIKFSYTNQSIGIYIEPIQNRYSETGVLCDAKLRTLLCIACCNEEAGQKETYAQKLLHVAYDVETTPELKSLWYKSDLNDYMLGVGTKPTFLLSIILCKVMLLE